MSRPQYKALVLTSKFGEFSKVYVDAERPGPGELLVEVEAVGLNPVDWKIQTYGIIAEKFPSVLGTDVAGIVEEVGKGISNFVRGDRICWHGPWRDGKAGGGFQQYAIAEAATSAKIPDHMSFDFAATIPSSVSTVAISYYCAHPHGAALTSPLETSGRGKYAGIPLIVLGGASSVGGYAIQFGKLSSLKHEAFLFPKDLRRDSSEVAKITTLPIKLVYDAVSTDQSIELGYDILAIGGQMVVVQPFNREIEDGKDIIQLSTAWHLPHTEQLGADLYAKLGAWIEDGTILPQRVEVLPGGLDAITDGLARHKAGAVSGTKLIVRPQETV